MPTLDYCIADGRHWRIDPAVRFDLAITLDFDGPQPAFFAPDPARSSPLRIGGFTGSVARGASCNCAVQVLAPHCHGTHTECVGHVTDPAVPIATVTPVAPALARLVSVHPERLGDDAAGPVSDPADLVITRRALEVCVGDTADAPWTALIVRTLPNGPDKRHRRYAGPSPAPYFTADAMTWIVAQGVTSLVVDLPSLDRADDGGTLAAHRVYWGLPPGSTDAREARRGTALVTELAYIPDAASDGLYLLDLQVPAFGTDAAPSRPVLYPAQESHRP